MTKGKLLELAAEAEIEITSDRPNSGGWIPALCPFAEFLHESGRDKNPSFFLKVSNDGVSAAHCFTCKAKGRLSSIIRQLAYYRGLNYNELVMQADLEDIPADFGNFEEQDDYVEARTPIVEDAYLNMYPLAWEHEESRQYLQQERIAQSGGYGWPIGREACMVMGLRFDPNHHRVLFPVRGRGGDLYGYSGRSVLPKQFHDHAKHPRIRDYEFDKSLSLLGEHLFQESKPILLVEGLFAYATMVELGARRYCNPMATMGSTLSEAQKEILTNLNEPVYLLYDLDEPGSIGLWGNPSKRMVGAVDMLRQHVPTRVCLYPEGVNDPDDLNAEEVARMISHDYDQY